MVRETRHLWVGNLPENIREDRIREHFKRYGRVQSVKLLPRGEECPVDGGSSSSLSEGNEGGSGSSSGGGGGGGSGGGGSSSNGGASATVAFMDIKSAAKAHATEHTLDERALTTQYYEPQHLQHRFPSHASSEDHGSGGGNGGGSGGTVGVSGGGGNGSGSTGSGVGGSSSGGERGDRGSESFDTRGSHGSFYGSERSNRVVGTGSVVGGVGSGSGSGSGGVSGHPADSSTGDPSGYISRNRPPPTSSYHVTSSRARDRLYPRSGPYVSGPPPPPHLDRHRGNLPPSSWSTYEPTSSRYGNAPPPPSPATNDAYQDEQGGNGGGNSSSSTLRQHKKQRRKSRSGSSSPSGSSRSGSSSSSRSGSSAGSTSGGSTSAGSSPHRTSNAAVTEDRRPLAICVRNLPTRSSDTSLKDGLFHEYKKHGKVTWVKVVGAAGDRYALVCFKKPEDVEKALEVSQDKLFFGCKIEVAPYQGYDVEDNEFRPYEAELDEYHPKATRTLFIGNLEKDVTASELRKHFEPFGEIIEIDIKKQGAVSSYAFCQYSDIGSVVKAMRSMDGEHLGANRIKLGFGKSMPTSCVWVDGIGDCISEKYLNMQFHQFGPITQIVVDRERGHALVFFDQISCAQAAVKEMRGAALRGRRLQVDFASRECQETFYEHLERQGNSNEKPWDSRPSPASSFDVTRERSSFDSAVTVSSSSSRFTRYDTPPRSRTASYSRTSGGSTPGASPAHPTAMSRSNRRSYQDSYYDGDYGEPASRRFRSYDEFSQGSGASHDDYQSSVLSDGKLNDDDCPPPSRRHAVQSVVTSVDPPAPPPPLLPPPDIRHLQKERVHLLEQLEECHSSGDEVGFAPKKRAKHDSSSTTILCEDDEPEIASLLVTSHSSRKGMDFRRVSDSKVVMHHNTRRASCEGRGPGPCKRRRDTTNRHHEHHDGSRPGTPLVDERPENLVPSEPRRFRERSHEGPLSLPLPRFAAQMLNNNNTSSSNNNNGSSTRSSSTNLAKVASPPCASLSIAPSPRAAPQPPASPPARHTSSSPTSSDSETAPQSPSLEERIRSLDEKYEKWSGSRALSAAGGDALAKLDASASERFRFRHKLLDLDLHEVQPSDIVKSVLAKRSVFDEDSKRLENFSEKYEPREFTGVIGVSSMIGSTAGLTVSSGCTSKVCLQYPFPSHPPVQPTSGTSVTNQIGINTSLSTSLTPTTTMVSSALKTDLRMVQHNCIHPTPATPITPGTSIKTVSPELPPVSLPIGLGSGTATSSGNGSGLASVSSLLSSNGSVGSIHNLGASTHRGLSISATTASPMVTATDAFATAITTVTVPVTTLSAALLTSATISVTGALSSMTTTSSIVPSSSITSSSNSSSSSSLSASSTDMSRSRLRKEISGSNRENRDFRDVSRESKHSKGKDCQRRSRKDEADVERNRKGRDEKESSNIANDIGNTDNHKDFKDNKELRYERKEREEKERRDKEDREKQDRRDKEDRERQEKKERDERERREKDEERREKERLDKERQEKDKKEREERERERKEREENELKEKERREKERIDRERREREEKERQERREREERERREREERERKEREIRLEREKQEKERLRREREEQERREKEERDRLERERKREEKERLERERKREREEKERLERERRKEKEEREKIEKEKREKEERERVEREKHEREKRREREDQERREKEKAEREKRRDREEKEKRDRDDSRRQSTENHLHSSITQSQTQTSSAPVAIKRRCSSQDGPMDEDAKRMKISDHRRDSKDRSRQNRRSEDRKHRNDSHRSSRESRESRDSKESSNVTQDNRDNMHSESIRETNSRDSGKERQRNKRNRSEKESRERSPRVSHESDKEFLSRLELSKKNDSSSLNEQTSIASNHTRDVHHQQQQHSTLNSHSDADDGPLSTHEIQVARNPSATDTDSDEPKKHSIFDIVDDEPAYISMYDKVKARSTKNMQKLEEEKRQVRLKDKFSQLKQSRARREEKKQSTSWDGDSVSSKALTEDEATSESDSTRTKSLSRKGSRSRIHSDTSEEEEPFNNKIRKPIKAERFLESDVDLGFADTEEKQNVLEASNVIVNSVHTNIKEETRTSDEDERISVGFRANHPVIANNHDRDPRKKSHKKKQKRQKNSVSSEDTLKVESTETVEHKNKTNVITSNVECRPNHNTESTTIAVATTIAAIPLENPEERMRADKKQRSKKDKRRDRNGEDKSKARRKRLNRQEARDSQRMEDIFGPLSDDVDDGPSNTFFNRFGNMTSENSAYASDSDGGHSSLDMDRVRRKTEKKRRHQPEDENSVDLAEAGREIEAKLLGMPNSPKATPTCTNESNDHDVFRFTDDNDSVEPSTPSTIPEKIKEKKKKRKKSKEERSRKDYHHHHHHHHHHHEKSGELSYLAAEPSSPRASSPLVPKTISPSLPTPRDTLLSPIPKVTSNVSTVSSISPPVVSSSIQTSKSEKKKDKFIPGFGIEIDETIHENAVKSISEPDERGSNQSRNNREEPEVSVPTTPPAQHEDKPRVAISQEETEDAVAALLEETFGASTEDFSYEGEEEEDGEADGVTEAPTETPQEDVEETQQAVDSLNASIGEGDADLKPDTPQSEHDLQIDTDTEEDPNYETVDLTQPPKTPDIPSFYKSPTKILNMTPVLTTSEKPVEIRLSTVTKPQSPPNSVIAHSWNLNEHNKPRESVKQPEIAEADIISSERIAQTQRDCVSPSSPQYKQSILASSIPITNEIPKSLTVANTRPSSITPLYQRLPVSPQSQMVPMRQASPKMQNITTVSCSSSSNTTSLPPLVPSRIPPLVSSQQLSPRISQPLSPNGQWSRNPTISPHISNMGKRKASPPPTKIAVCVPIPAHRPEAPIQQIYSTAATQQPVIQHASGMLAPVPGYPRGGLPPLTLNIPPRPYMPVPPLASGIQIKNSRDSSLSGKSVIETLLPVNPNESSQRLEEPKLSPAVIPEPTNKASTSPKVPSPNQPPTYIPETAKIEINASTSSQMFSKPPYITDSYSLSSRTQKHVSVSITTDNNLLSPRQKQEVSNLQLLTTHVRSSTPSPVIVAHCQSHLIHKPIHSLGPPTVSSSNQPLIKTVVPIVPQQITSSIASSMPSDNKCITSQTPPACQRHSPVSQSQLIKSHVPLVSTVSQTIITRVVSSTVSSISTPSVNEQIIPKCSEPRPIIQEQQMELDTEAQISQTAQPMQLTPPIQPTQPIDEIKQESTDVKQENTVDETKHNIVESEKSLNELKCIEDNVKPKQEKEEVIKTEIAPCVPKVETMDTIVPKLETVTPIKLESVNEIKEEDVTKDNDEIELDEEPVEDPLKEPSTDPLAIDSKEDPTDNKEDSDYWSAKEVNIESVIKKVDALCDGEGNDGDDEIQQTESMNSDSHDANKNESDWFDESMENESKKNFVSIDEHDESIETCENESTRSRRGRTKSRRGSRGGVTTRRGRNANAVPYRRGGRSPRGSKHHVEKNKLPADVYEFHDDSEEDNAGRPRLILTIKSPGPNVTGSNAQPATPVAAVKEIPPEEFLSPATNTRKSRRLAERDGSRNTVDDVIEDVVRGSPANKGLTGSGTGNVHATRRSTRHNNVPRNIHMTQQTAVPLTELRKSPRGNRKTVRRTSENNDDSGEEKTKEVTITQENTNKEEPKLTQPESPKVEELAQTITPMSQKTISLEPMTLIDPVTGMLIPMRESEEGQYIPVSTSSGQAQTTNRILCEPRSGGLINANATSNEISRAKPVPENSLLIPIETKKEPIIEHTSSQPAPSQQIQPQTSVITKPQSPAIQVTSTITVVQSSATCTTITATATTTPIIASAQAAPISSSQTKPTSLKAHVLNASKLITSTPQQVVITKAVTSLSNQTIVHNIIKSPTQAIQGGLNLQISPGRAVSPSLSPRAKQATQLVPSNIKQGQPMSPVLNNTGVPPNPKQHLLQAAAKQQTSTIVNISQKIPMNTHSASVSVNTSTPRIHQPVSQPTTLKGINGQSHPLNPKTHLLQAVVPPITGTIASSPTQSHLVPQSISTGVSNVRPSGPKASTAGTIEPQKMEVPMSSCIMVPTASPQARNVPMPTYEAPLHGGTGATPTGGQYGLVTPHRSQSPPLPPPAHHHVNTSQSEVVNHYGLTRGGELPPHYLHPQMLQYQYLRAQQEALTAPRIAYHIPGTRSPHLPLDPKLETGIEDNHSPPLELRRGTRTPQDRTTDSPQVAQVYMLHSGVRLPPPPPQYNAGSNPSLPGAPTGARASYYEPPPAHLRSQYPMAASEAPPEMGRATTPERCRKHQVVTPPYASQVPPQADSFQMLLQRYPVMWQGLLALKNDQAAVQMHFVFGNPNVARDSLPCNSDGSTPPLRIAQRMRLEQTQVDGVARKMQTDNEHCMLLALPCGRDEVDVLQQSKNLQTGFIMYLQQKQAAGIVNIAAPGSQQPAYVVHIFPSCDFAHENLARIAPDLLHRVAKIAHLLIVIATV